MRKSLFLFVLWGVACGGGVSGSRSDLEPDPASMPDSRDEDLYLGEDTASKVDDFSLSEEEGLISELEVTEGDPGDEGAGQLGEDRAEIEGLEPHCPEDDLWCTETYMDEDGDCVTVLKPGFCLIGNRCWFAFEPSPDAQCLFCVPEVDTSVFVPAEGLPCDDGDPCTAGDWCSADGECLSGVPVNCDDGNVCTIEWCEKGYGCRYEPYQSVCDDNNACTYQDHCENGKCVGLNLPCKDANPCTDDLCDPKIGCIFPFNTAPCDDKDACTINDHCLDGECKGTPLDCDDYDPCTLDSCYPDFGCFHQWHYGPCDDGNACTVNDYCTGDHVCLGYPKVCDDNNPCTDDTCDPKAGCVFWPNNKPCDDGDPCTIGDQCNGGKCSGVPVDCEDGNLCTIDWCDWLGCHHEFTTGLCDDKNACTAGDNCATGKCVGVPVICDDNNPCTIDTCDPTVGCIFQPIPGPCDDGNLCTINDHCEAGVCVGLPKNCDDNDPCTIDSCTTGGVCVHTPHSGPCDDGDACTVNDVCKSGKCVGEPRSCDDNNPCTIDSCHKEWGCVYTPSEPKPCDDHSVCTVNDHCANGVCTGTPIVCFDGNPCTLDECDPISGCYYVPYSGPCDDLNVCTVDDKCVAGKCAGTSVFTGLVGKSATLSIGVSGNPGQGLDVDQNPATCAPKGSCVKGIDNAFAVLSWLFNAEITKAVSNGKFALILEWRKAAGSATKGNLYVYYGERWPDATCDPALPGCLWGLYPGVVSGVCEPKYGFEGELVGNFLAAGTKDSVVPFYLVFGDLRILVMLESARIEASLAPSGGTVGQGVLAGAVRKNLLMSAIQAAPADKFPPPYTRDLVLQYIEIYLQPDMDLDLDGTKESISIGVPFTLVSGQIIGILK